MSLLPTKLQCTFVLVTSEGMVSVSKRVKFGCVSDEDVLHDVKNTRDTPFVVVDRIRGNIRVEFSCFSRTLFLHKLLIYLQLTNDYVKN